MNEADEEVLADMVVGADLDPGTDSPSAEEDQQQHQQQQYQQEQHQRQRQQQQSTTPTEEAMVRPGYPSPPRSAEARGEPPLAAAVGTQAVVAVQQTALEELKTHVRDALAEARRTGNVANRDSGDNAASNTGGNTGAGVGAPPSSPGRTGGDGAGQDTGQYKPPVWTMEQAFSADLGKLVVGLVKDSLELQDEDEAIALKRLGSLDAGRRLDLLRELLERGDCTRLLAEELSDQVADIAAADALTGHALNDKFATTTGTFDMVFGDKATYLEGLEPRIGLPDAKILEAMVKEHCFSEDSKKEWTTGNYGITTTSRQEFLIVVMTILVEFETSSKELKDAYGELWEPVRARVVELKDLVKDFRDLPDPDRDWKPETENTGHPRATNHARDLLKRVLEKNLELAALDGGRHPALRLEELIMCNLYTGPLFEKYNQVHRGGSLLGGNLPFMERKFVEYCCGNRYTTSQFVLTSGMVKLSVLSKKDNLYRGVQNGLLPRRFWVPDLSGYRGGVELGFMSTTKSRDVACQYMRNSAIQTIFEISPGLIDNGAELGWVSQYPHEEETCFPPLTALEVVETRCERNRLCVSLRLNLNLTNDTIEKVIGKRLQVVRSLCTNLEQEVKQALNGPSSLWGNLFACAPRPVYHKPLTQIKQLALEHLQAKFKSLQEHDPEYYNTDAKFLDVVEKSLHHATSVKFCSGKLFLQMIDAAEKRPEDQQDTISLEVLSDICFPLAKQLLEVDHAGDSVERKATYASLCLPKRDDDIDWVFHALGFRRWHHLWVASEPDLPWRDASGSEAKTLPQLSNQPLPPEMWLVELEGFPQLELGALVLAQRWRQAKGPPFQLVARFKVSRPWHQKELEVAWVQSSPSNLQATAHLQRIWAISHPSEDEDWSWTEPLGETGLMFRDRAFANAAKDGSFSRLKRLRLGTASRFTFRELCAGLTFCPSLEVLDLTHANLSSVFPLFFGEALVEGGSSGRRPLAQLRSLLLDNNPELGKTSDFAVFLDGLAGCDRLEEVSLSSCSIGPSFLTALVSKTSEPTASGTRYWPDLASLRLADNPALGGDRGGDQLANANSIVESWSTFSELKVLGLARCGLGDDFADAFVSILANPATTSLMMLERLELDQTEFSDEAVSRVKSVFEQERPDTKISISGANAREVPVEPPRAGLPGPLAALVQSLQSFRSFQRAP